MTDIINLLLGALMGSACMILFARLHQPDPAHQADTPAPESGSRGDAAFVLFWGIWWWIILVVFALFHFAHAPLWVAQCFDMVGNASLFVAAYALYKGKDFQYHSRHIVHIIVATIILIAFCAVAGLFAPERSELASPERLVDWQVLATAPSQVLATTAFILLGMAGGERFPDFRVSIYLLCGTYAILQVPAYHAVFIEPIELPTASGAADFWKWSLAAGKVALALCAAGILGVLTTKRMKWLRIVFGFLGALFGFLVAAIKFTSLLYG